MCTLSCVDRLALAYRYDRPTDPRRRQIVKHFVRTILDRVLLHTDYVLADRSAPPQGLDYYVGQLRNRGFEPRTVLDVGVGPGTPWLYRGFPSARFELFEPLDFFVPAMERICEEYDARYHICALGSESGQSTIEVNWNVPTGSTMAGRMASSSLNRTAESKHKSGTSIVEVRRLDDFGPFAGPSLLKLDVEGFEGEVLKGAQATLRDIEVIISEVGVTQRHLNEMSFGAFASFMETLGFSLIDIPEISTVRRNGPLAYVDAVFVRTDSAFRL